MDVWSKVYQELQKHFDSSLNRAILDKIIFREVRNNDTIVLTAPDHLTSGWFTDNYLNLAQKISRNLYNREYRFEIVLAQTDQAYQNVVVKAEKKKTEKNVPNQLNPKYTFDRFIVGPNNDFAHAAAVQVASHPAKSYNPLYIYGPSALGKTHLLQAIVHKVIKEKPDLDVYYTTSENFMNDFIESVRDHQMPKFRKKYRSFDVLLIDDVQFLQDKQGTLDELFHTFNELFQERKQLVFACDRPAKGLTSMEERLKTRFDSGLSIKIEIPNYETRKAILLSKTAEEKTYVPEEVVDYIAQNVESDIRLLEGSLTKIIAYSNLKKKDVSLDLAREILRDKIKMDMPKNITITDIQKVVSRYFNISVNDLKSERRLENITYARHIAMFLSKEYTNHSLTEIGSLFGDKAHTTVMRSAEKVNKLLKTRKQTKKEIDEIMNEFYNVRKEAVS